MTTRYYYNGHSYEVVTTARNWANASSNAQSLGAHLATIGSAGENSFLLGIAKAQTSVASMPAAADGGGAYYLWLGASDLASEGQWRWVDGSSMAAYSNWGAGSGVLEPDNYNNQDCLALAVSGWPYNSSTPTSGAIGDAGQWNDINAADVIYALIEWDYLKGTAAADRITGSSSADTLQGYAGRDTLDGGAGSDTALYTEKTGSLSVTLNGSTAATLSVGGVAEDSLRNIESLYGGSAADTLNGDSQANLFRGGNGRDLLNGNGGLDTADYGDKTTSVVVTLNGSTSMTVSVGGVAEDSLRNIEHLNGGSAADTLTGDSLTNRLSGAAGNDLLRGMAGRDTLIGGSGNDRLFGGNDNDVLSGGSGSDSFVFDSAAGTTHFDTISDFTSGSDRLLLDDDIYSRLGTTGTSTGTALTSSAVFQLGTAANDAGDRLIYNKSTGVLYYDADGSGAAAQLAIVTLGGGTSLTASDIWVLA